MKNCKFLFMIIFLLTTSSALNLGLWQSTTTTSISTSNALLSLQSLPLEGHFLFSNLHHAATDFGNRISHTPSAILHPRSVSDISTTLTHLYRMGPRSHLTVAARGHGHSLQGQAQAHGGIVISMESLAAQGKNSMRVHSRGRFVDVCGGELWISVLKECLKFGLAPKSWTDYLHLTVGGTLSNAGISGQAFKHGPQISNVHQLEVVTGRGEVMNCSEKQNPDLFYSVLGGLGQFGIITRARISLEPAPTKVKWIRVLYSDFTKFANDQELLITSKKNQTFDYVEGFVIINRTGILNNWRSSFNPQDPVQASQFNSDGRTLYCLEVAKYYTTEETEIAKQETERLLSSLSYIRSTLFMSEVGYLDFLDRVHVSEMKLRAKGLWQVPHPWLNLLVPRSKINEFAKGVFGNILVDTINGPILIYPVDRSKWDRRTSAVIPEEEEGEDDQIFYLVALLSSAVPNSNGKDGLEYIDRQNRRVLEFCERGNLGVKQYLPHYSTQEQWKTHFGGSKWQVFRQRKREYDPLSLLGPGHRIFAKGGGGDAFL